MSNASKMNIVFFHPDLGIGGAERLVVDAAVGLQKLGHHVTIFTSHCDRGHCFDEAKDGTLDVRVRGNTIVPPSILSRFSILCAILRQLHLISQITLLTGELRKLAPSAFFIDQLSTCVPILRLIWPHTRILFYCHFPDKLLAERLTWWKGVYRLPFDWLEGWSTACANVVVVNSIFTRSVVRKAFPNLPNSQDDLRIVYPCVKVGVATPTDGDRKDVHQVHSRNSEHDMSDVQAQGGLWKDGKKLLLSINRFEHTKNIGLAIRAFAGLSIVDRKNTRLVLAGGYDPRLQAQTAYYKSLVVLAESLLLRTATASDLITALSPTIPAADVVFLLSIPSSLKQILLQNATMLIYTPKWEHFGIVPLEAMLAGIPVLAADTGGPKESVLDGENGWLRNTEDTEGWTKVIEAVIKSASLDDLVAMGRKGRRRVQEKFSRDVMAHRFEEILVQTKAEGRVGLCRHGPGAFSMLVLVAVFSTVLWQARLK